MDSFCFGRPNKLRRPIATKIGRVHPTPEWRPCRHVDIPIFPFLFPSFIYFFSFLSFILFSLLSLSLFGAPLVTPGVKPPGYAPDVVNDKIRLHNVNETIAK